MNNEEYNLTSVNEYTHDLDSYRTGRGKHSRVLPSKGPYGAIGARIDVAHGLRDPSEAEIRTICRFEGWKPHGKMTVLLKDNNRLPSYWVEFQNE